MSRSGVTLAVLAAWAVVLATGLVSGANTTANPAERGVGPDGAEVISSLLGSHFRICCGNEYDQRSPAVGLTGEDRHETILVASGVAFDPAVRL
jgi:hypothetical protein